MDLPGIGERQTLGIFQRPGGGVDKVFSFVLMPLFEFKPLKTGTNYFLATCTLSLSRAAADAGLCRVLILSARREPAELFMAAVSEKGWKKEPLMFTLGLSCF